MYHINFRCWKHTTDFTDLFEEVIHDLIEERKKSGLYSENYSNILHIYILP